MLGLLLTQPEPVDQQSSESPLGHLPAQLRQLGLAVERLDQDGEWFEEPVVAELVVPCLLHCRVKKLCHLHSSTTSQLGSGWWSVPTQRSRAVPLLCPVVSIQLPQPGFVAATTRV